MKSIYIALVALILLIGVIYFSFNSSVKENQTASVKSEIPEDLSNSENLNETPLNNPETMPECGDGFCALPLENCTDCPEDCGVCE